MACVDIRSRYLLGEPPYSQVRSIALEAQWVLFALDEHRTGREDVTKKGSLLEGLALHGRRNVTSKWSLLQLTQCIRSCAWTE